MTADAIYDPETFPYSLDGVVNNVDGLDEENEFKDHVIANVIQGHVRLDHSEGKERRSGRCWGVMHCWWRCRSSRMTEAPRPTPQGRHSSSTGSSASRA